ncbi:hypothetical protein B0H14DRAFT_3520640 [Mycena olivaceomarginata]|nr:hypothetical protein B0H14DRAFT_3520640 [Mycena olivaceomarginata]
MDRWAESPHQSERCYPGGVNPADDTLVGVWVNGKVNDLVDWYLVEAYVPCFFISELPRSLPVSRIRATFLEGTSIEQLLENEFERLAVSQRIPFTKIELFSPLQANLRPTRDLDRVAACLHWQLDAPWACPLFESDSLDDACHRMEIPPVSSDAVSKGQWEVFAQVDPEEDEPDVGPLMRRRGARSRGKGDAEGDEEVWYDRKMKRKLIFSDLPALPGFLEQLDDKFGRPVPGWAFGSRSNENWIGAAPSLWMYRREKASRQRVGERYSPPTPLAQSPVVEAPRVITPPTTLPVRDISPSEGSVVSLGPEEDIDMTEIGTQGVPEVPEAPALTDNELSYVLISGHSFAFGLGDLRLWLRHPATAVTPSSILGIYRLVQSDYRVDYFFEVRGARDAEQLRQAGERNPRSAGARSLSPAGFERATMGLRRSGIDASPPPEDSVEIWDRDLRRRSDHLPLVDNRTLFKGSCRPREHGILVALREASADNTLGPRPRDLVNAYADEVRRPRDIEITKCRRSDELSTSADPSLRTEGEVLPRVTTDEDPAPLPLEDAERLRSSEERRLRAEGHTRNGSLMHRDHLRILRLIITSPSTSEEFRRLRTD